MKKLLLMVCALFGFMACTQNPIEEQSAIRTDAPETIRVGFEDNETRIQLNSAQKTVWTKGDLVSVFYRSDANQKWQYQGETGERVGDLKRVENATSTTKTTKTVVVYPYSDSYWLNTDTFAIDATLPATQYYAEGSYGIGSNLMVSQSEFTQFSLKSVCGWLKLQLTGDGAVVKSIKFRGNNDEQVAGLIYVDTATAEATLASEMGGTDDNNAGGNLIFDDTVVTEVTLDCGEGVTLGTEATSFYIALPPQTFENGFTVVVECDNHKPMTLSTLNALTIERNTIQPMASVKVELESIVPKPANNEIWYTNGSTTEATTPNNVFDVNIVSNTYDAEKGWWVIKFDGEVTKIGDWAFYNRSSLTGVTIGDSVTEIGDGAFSGCSSLTSVYISDLSAWCRFSFEDYSANPLYYAKNLYLNNKLVTDLVIPSDITEIKPYAFENCSSLTSVTIGDSVTTIGEDAFRNCSSLTSVTIGDSVTTIGDCAFRFCDSLTSVTIGDSVTEIGDGAFEGCTGELTVNCNIPSASSCSDGAFYGSKFTSVTIGDSVTTIGHSAFYSCSSLTSVTIGDSVTTIGGEAFDGCSSLTSVTIPNNVTTIGRSAFYSCSSLTSVTIPDSVTTIGKSAFSGCSSLTSVTIGDSVTTIGEWAFSSCSNLTSVYISDLSAWCRISFEDYSANPLYYAKNLYLNNKLVTDHVIPSDITEIKPYAFYNCSSLTSVTISDSVTTIGDYAFRNCSSLTSVTIGDSVTTIGKDAFYYCRSLTSVTIGDSVTTIGDYAFEDCSSLTSVTIPGSVTTIGGGAFNGCSSLTSVTIPDSVTTIGNNAFQYCGSLTSITIPDSVTTIGDYAFEDCSSLTSVTIGDSVTTIGEWAFRDCSSLTSVTIPDSVTTIGYYAFCYCYSLTSVYCKATTPPAVTLNYSSEWYAFSANASGRKIYVPMESVEAYKSAEYWSAYKSSIEGYNF